MEKQTTVTCGHCDGTGWRPTEREGLRAVVPCDCRKASRSPHWWLEKAQIPPRFRDCDFEHFMPLNNPSLEMAKMKAQSFAQQYPLVEKGVLLLGNPGVGKTHLVVSVMRQLMLTRSVDCLFCSFPDMLEKLQESYDPVSQLSKADILDPILHTEVVAIDDLGARRISDWVEDTVTSIITYRCNNRKPLIATTNVDAEPVMEGGRIGVSLAERIGPRACSRLFEMCKVVRIRGVEDYRRRPQAV